VVDLAVETTKKAPLAAATDAEPILRSMSPDQPIELLVSQGRGTTYAIPAIYVADLVPGTDQSPRRLTGDERAAVTRAGAMLADAIAGQPVDELALQDAIELLHRLSALTEGQPHFRLADGRLIDGGRARYRASTR
jgi:hypothetical protein